MERSPSVLRYVYGNRLAPLADRLIDDLAAQPLADPMASEIVLVPHPGIGRWLQQRVAQRLGIAAFIDFVLPAGFVWRTVARWRPELPRESAYEREALCWRLQAMLPQLARRPGFEAMAEFLGSDGAALRRFELADALADLYDRYLVYRPQWLARWERGRGAGIEHPHEAWQGALWRALSAAVGEPARAVLLQEWLQAATREAVTLPASRLSVFGVSSLPALYLDFIAALAQQVPVSWYHLNPVSEYWGDDPTVRERRRLTQRLAAQGVAEPERHLAPAHPLIESCGEIGRDFMRLLYGLESVALDEQPLDPSPSPVQDDDGTISWLEWLRTGMAAQDLAAEPLPRSEPRPSLRVHACASAQREVEVLHDALLDLMARDPSLTPRDIVVMSPRIERHAPLVEAVFRQAPESRRLPLTVSDRPGHDAHPMLRAFRRLLDLPQSRLPVDDVMDLLAVPALARRFDLDADAQAALLRWLAQVRVRWGLDGADRAAIGATRYEDFSWRAGLDRLLLGYATGPVDDLLLVGGLAPAPDVEGQSAVALGALSHLVELLARWRGRLAGPRTALQWQGDWIQLLQELVAHERLDEEEQQVWNVLAEEIEAFAQAVARGGAANAVLEGDVACRAMLMRLEQPARRQRFLAAGVTVCAMVPLRSVPFRVVCLLGMNDGEFPRREASRSIDLMRAFPAPGDRSRRADDRYLFLEAILAAEQHLHISYAHTNPRDGSERSAAPPVLELLDCFSRAEGCDAPDSVRAQILRKHPAVAHAPESFAPESPSRSYASEWLATAQAAAAPAREPLPFAALDTAGAIAAPATDEGPVETIALAEIESFFRRPARDYLRRVLELELPRESELEAEEPLVLDGLDAWSANQALLELVLAQPHAGDAALQEQLRARALLPPGQIGEWDGRSRIAMVRALYGAYAAAFGAAPQKVAIEALVGGSRLLASSQSMSPRGPVRLRIGKVGGADWLVLALLARATGHAQAWSCALDQGSPKLMRLDAATLGEEWFSTVIATWRRSRRGFVPLLGRASWEYACVLPRGDTAARRAARQMFGGGSGFAGSCELDDPHVALLWRDRRDAIDDAFAEMATAIYAPLAAAVEEVSP